MFTENPVFMRPFYMVPVVGLEPIICTAKPAYFLYVFIYVLYFVLHQ